MRDCSDRKIEVIVTGFQYGIHIGVRKTFIGGIVTGFDVDKDGILFRIDEVIEQGFRIYILRSAVMEILGVV